MRIEDQIVVIRFLMVFIVLLMVTMSFITLRKVLKYYKLLTTELQIKLLRKRIDPHFLGNLLQSLNVFFDRGQKDDIHKIINEYSNLVKTNFEYLDSDTVPLEQEIRMLMQFLHTHNLMSEGKIHYELRASIHSTNTNLMVPAMLLQPLLENALEHGIKHNPNPQIILEFHVADTLRIRIIDNGVGMDHQVTIKHNGSLNVTLKRIRLLNELSKEHYTMRWLNDLSEYHIERGCGIEITLPVTPSK